MNENFKPITVLRSVLGVWLFLSALTALGSDFVEMGVHLLLAYLFTPPAVRHWLRHTLTGALRWLRTGRARTRTAHR